MIWCVAVEYEDDVVKLFCTMLALKLLADDQFLGEANDLRQESNLSVLQPKLHISSSKGRRRSLYITTATVELGTTPF